MRPNPQETEGLVTFTEEIHNGKLHFLCSKYWQFLTAFSFSFLLLVPVKYVLCKSSCKLGFDNKVCEI